MGEGLAVGRYTGSVADAWQGRQVADVKQLSTMSQHSNYSHAGEKAFSCVQLKQEQTVAHRHCGASAALVMWSWR